MPGQADDVGVHGAFDAVEHGAHPHAVERVHPRVPRSKRDSIVIAVREAEPEQEPSAGVRAERRKDLVAQRAHSGRADQDHAFVVKADLTLVTPELERGQPVEGRGEMPFSTRRRRRCSRRGPFRWRDHTPAGMKPMHVESERFSQKFRVRGAYTVPWRQAADAERLTGLGFGSRPGPIPASRERGGVVSVDASVWLDALGARRDAPAAVRAMLASDGALEPLPIPQAREWLAIHEERGQTFDDFVRAAVRPAVGARTIYIQPVDAEGALTDTCLSTLAAFTAAFFQLKVRVLSAARPRPVVTRDQGCAGRRHAAGVCRGHPGAALCRQARRRVLRARHYRARPVPASHRELRVRRGLGDLPRRCGQRGPLRAALLRGRPRPSSWGDAQAVLPRHRARNRAHGRHRATASTSAAS